MCISIQLVIHRLVCMCIAAKAVPVSSYRVLPGYVTYLPDALDDLLLVLLWASILEILRFTGGQAGCILYVVAADGHVESE